MITGRIGRLVAGLCLGSALALAAQTADAQSRSERGVYDRLAQYGITPDQVVELNIYPRRDNNDRVQGAEAWVRVEPCPQGWVVMTVGRTGTVTYAYTRDGCSIPGLDEA
ncbi:MAG: hypothetical protein AAGJ28_03545 [Pseudomonadota bacterium]